MYTFVILAVSVFWFVAAFLIGNIGIQQFHEANAQFHKNNLAVIGKAISRAAAENPLSLYQDGFAYPQKGEGRINTQKLHYQYLNFSLPDNVQYGHAQGEFRSQTSTGTLNGLRERRLVLWMESPLYSFKGKDDYLAGNTCGSATDGVGASRWCGADNSMWLNIESGPAALVQIESEQQRLYRLSRKFYRLYGAERTFNVLAATGTSKPLVGYTTKPTLTASSCTGTVATAVQPGMVFNCSDLFNAWGEPVWLHVLASNHVVITNVLGLKHQGPATNNVEKPVRLAEDIHIDARF